MKRFLLGIFILLALVSSVSGIEIVRQKNVATYIFFPIIDADGDIVTSAAALDSETDTFADGVVPDGFSDLTNEATEIGTDGWYYISLTQAEMNFDYIAIQIKTSTTGAKTQHILIRTTIGDPLNFTTTATAGNELVVDASGRIDVGSWLGQAVTLSTGNKPDVNVDEISDDTTAPGNLELQYDGTGLIGDTFPFTQSGGAALGGGISIKTTMASVAVILGSEQDLVNANTSDDTRWTGDDDGSGAEFIFRCTPVSTSSIPVELSFEGYYDEPTGSSNGATLQVYNFNTVGWDTIMTLVNSNKDEKHQVSLSHAHKAPGGGTLETVVYTIGDVLLKFLQDTTETGNAVLLIDYIVVGFVNGLVTAIDIFDEW